jgi:hypothetical protein
VEIVIKGGNKMNIAKKNIKDSDWRVVLSESNGFSITISTPQYFITFENSEELETFLSIIGKSLFNNSKDLLKESKNNNHIIVTN